MAVVVGVLTETAAKETRVAVVPEIAAKLKTAGVRVLIERGAGNAAHFPDALYTDAEFSDAATILASADVLLKVQPPSLAEVAALKKGAIVIGYMQAYSRPDLVRALKDGGITSFAMELVPRISRAQSMDALSSQASVAGYKAVLIAANTLEKFLPMLTTAAGTIRPASVLVIGAGVAGLQAIATARRLGGIVSGTDVRPAAKEEIKSLGASYVGVEDEETAKQTGPYAGQMSEAFRQKQADLMVTTVAKNDIIICTALVQGRKAPVIVTSEMVAAMRPGSVIVDLAADSGGNCGATKPGEDYITDNGVRILGHRNWPSRIAVAASQLYARNLLTFLTTFWDKDAKAPKLKEDDAIIKGVMLTRAGAVVHPNFAPKAEPAPEPAAAPPVIDTTPAEIPPAAPTTEPPIPPAAA